MDGGHSSSKPPEFPVEKLGPTYPSEMPVSTFPFEKLPLELRIQIYHCMLQNTTGRKPTHGNHRPLALMRANKKIHEEFKAELCTQTTFCALILEKKEDDLEQRVYTSFKFEPTHVSWIGQPELVTSQPNQLATILSNATLGKLEFRIRLTRPLNVRHLTRLGVMVDVQRPSRPPAAASYQLAQRFAPMIDMIRAASNIERLELVFMSHILDDHQLLYRFVEMSYLFINLGNVGTVRARPQLRPEFFEEFPEKKNILNLAKRRMGDTEE